MATDGYSAREEGMRQITLTRPDDWHLHLRDGVAMASVVNHTAAHFKRAVVMPNLRPPVLTAADATAYRARILAAAEPSLGFVPLMTLYLTDKTTPEQIAEAHATGHVVACKLYPAGATTNSDSGVTDLGRLRAVMEAMRAHRMPLLVHGEVTHVDVDIFDRETRFLGEVLGPLLADFPGLSVVLEHITTRDAVEFVSQGPDHLGATITAHHLLMNRNHMLVGGIRPHLYCLPVLKRESDREALLAAATSGSPRFFLGTDSAPHAVGAKQSVCGCAGCYTAPMALALYAEAFDEVGALDKLEAFASFHGPDFYGLPRNSEKVSLLEKPVDVPETLRFGDDTVRPLRAGESVRWTVQVHGLAPHP